MNPTQNLRCTIRIGKLRRKPGFALIVTLSLMILLTVIAVGLLTLSSISLRSVGQNDATARARANAKLALMLALGELQKTAGPDQRITARADVVDQNIANSRLTGVWKSWKIDASSPPTESDYEKAERDKKFVGWLASSADGVAAAQMDFAKQPPANPVTLWGKGSLGTSAPAADMVMASKILSSRGALAWAVMDEGVKVRVNTPFSQAVASTGEKTSQLGTGVRPNVASISHLDKLKRSFFELDSEEFADIEKGVSPSNFALAAENLAPGAGSFLKPLSHDVTSLSAGLLTDVAAGGLKEDFSLLANNNALPTAFAGKSIYTSRLGITGPSDPRWESLHQFARIYQDSTRLTATGGVPLLKARGPNGWKAATGSGATTTVVSTPPAGVVLMPTIAKVQMLFSLVGRDLYANLPSGTIRRPLTSSEKANGIHGPQDSHFRNTKYDYDLHLLYTPLITLHNPYNVALEFRTMKVEFLNVPFSMKIFRNGVAQSTDFVPLDKMYVNNETGGVDKTFGISLKTKANNAPGSPIFKLLPGEVKLFSPYIDPSLNWLNRGSFWDLNSALTASIAAIPGWTGDGVGYDCDWLAGDKEVDSVATNGRWESCLGLAWDDKIHVEFSPVSKPNVTRFVLKVSTTPTGSAETVTSAIEINYEKNSGLKEFLQSNGSTMPLRFPKADATPNFKYGYELVDRASSPIRDLKNVKPFALLSLQGKTTSGGRDTTMLDGRLATKPWCFSHANIGASSEKILSEHSANFSHEIDLQLLENGTLNLFSKDPQDRSNFISGHTSGNGAKFGAQYDIPLSPIQTLAGLNGANPGGSSGYLPRFAQPIGNSWAHPLLDMRDLKTGNYLDHSFLLNLALYDHFYFSGLADQTGPFGTGLKTADLAQGFIDGKNLSDPRLALHTPDGKGRTELNTELSSEATASDAYTRIASWQMMNGAFNINSTSVPAWKAMLGSVHDAQAIYNKLNKTSGSSSFSNLTPTDNAQNETRISRFRLPASESEKKNPAADPKDAYWLGAREYSDAELQTLAEKIVDQVRLRGPFLSMSEFVNRRLGAGDSAQRGALQQAIDDSKLNDSLAIQANAGFDIPSNAVSGYKYKNIEAGTGPSYQGAPGYLTQADLLSVLGNAATARSDTFTIRGYGEARDANNKIISTATCEAVIQRMPEYLDSADKAETPPAALTSVANQTFGRRLQVVSFRWLAPNEI